MDESHRWGKGHNNYPDLPSLWNEVLLGLVRLLKNSSNWKAWGDVSLKTQKHTVLRWWSGLSPWIGTTFNTTELYVNMSFFMEQWSVVIIYCASTQQLWHKNNISGVTYILFNLTMYTFLKEQQTNGKKGQNMKKIYGYDAYVHIRSPTTPVLKCN